MLSIRATVVEQPFIELKTAILCFTVWQPLVGAPQTQAISVFLLEFPDTLIGFINN